MRHKILIIAFSRYYRAPRESSAFYAILNLFRHYSTLSKTSAEMQTMGMNYVLQQPYNMAETYLETSPATPMFFVLFPGVDPTPWVESLARTLDITTENGERATHISKRHICCWRLVLNDASQGYVFFPRSSAPRDTFIQIRVCGGQQLFRPESPALCSYNMRTLPENVQCGE